MNIFREEGLIYFNGFDQQYSINGSNPDADIEITVDNEAVFCTDFEKSIGFTDYFECTDPEIQKLLQYATQFGVDI